MSDVSITLYTRENCHLCDEALTTIRRVADETGTGVDVETIDVDTDPQLRAEYGDRVPYVVVDGRPAFKYRIDDEEIRSLFAEA
ncbi:glutaredoxin family protein [Haloplanus salilacus]|uniref:glutaredoxin family protein n=1 Tax=Haloplanus salilacus TaxID=2949994 RepID=UPI0030CF6C7B